MSKRKNRRKKSEDDLLRDVIEQLKPIKNYMNLGEWEGSYQFADLDGPNAQITVNYTYLTFNMKIDFQNFVDSLQEGRSGCREFTGTLIHELAHIIVDKMYHIAVAGMTVDHPAFEYIKDIRENSVERIRKLVQQTLPDSLYLDLDIDDYNL